MKKQKIRIYDNGGKTFDRFTAVFMDHPERDGCFEARGMSTHPTHPQGFGMWTTAMPGRHLGKRITFEDLPEECRNVVTGDLSYLATRGGNK